MVPTGVFTGVQHRPYTRKAMYIRDEQFKAAARQLVVSEHSRSHYHVWLDGGFCSL